MGDLRLPERVILVELENAGQRGARGGGGGGGGEYGRTAGQRLVGCLALRGTGAPPQHVTLGRGFWYYAICEGSCRFMAT